MHGNEFDNEVTNQVRITSDYKQFTYSQYNRSIHLSKEMLKQATEGIISPIIVNEKMMVIDGQHRLEALKAVNKPVEYIVKPGLDEHDIVRINTVQRKWTRIDFAECFANSGNDNYMQLLDLVDRRIVNPSVLIQIALNSKTGMTKAEKIAYEAGRFEFYNYDKCVEFLEFYQEFYEKTGMRKRSNPARALYEIFKIEKFDAERLIHKILELGLVEELSIRTMGKSYAIKTFLEIYNNKLTTKSPLFIHFHIDSFGNMEIDEKMSEWATQQLTNEQKWNSVLDSPLANI